MLFFAGQSYPGGEEDSEDILDVRIRSTGWKGKEDPRPQRSPPAGSGAPHPSRRRREPPEDHRKKVSCSPIFYTHTVGTTLLFFSIAGTPKL